MPLFLTILEGTTPEEARPIMAIRDAQILATVRGMIHARLAAESPDTVVSLSKPRVKAMRRRGPHAGPLDTIPACMDEACPVENGNGPAVCETARPSTSC